MSATRFLNLPAELQDYIFDAYTEDVYLGFDLAKADESTKPADPTEPWDPFRYKWFLSLGDAHTHHEMPALLLVSKSIYRQFLVYLATHKTLYLPQETFFNNPAELAEDVKTQLPYWFAQALRQIAIVPVLQLPWCDDERTLYCFNGDLLDARGPSYAPPFSRAIQSFSDHFTRLQRIHLPADFLLTQYDAAHTPILKGVKHGDPNAYKTAVRLIAQSEFDRVAHGWAQGTGTWPVNVQLSLDLKLTMPSQAFGCDENDWPKWSVQVTGSGVPGDEIIIMEEVATEKEHRWTKASWTTVPIAADQQN